MSLSFSRINLDVSLCLSVHALKRASLFVSHVVEGLLTVKAVLQNIHVFGRGLTGLLLVETLNSAMITY